MLRNVSIALDELAPNQAIAALSGEHIDAVIQQGLEDCFTAAQVLVCRGEQVLWHRAYGDADLTTLFDLASVTKLFTTTGFLSLAGEGRVMLTLPVADVIPEFASASVDADGLRVIGEMHDPQTWGIIPPEAAYAGQKVNPRAVTFRHLLTHTGGLAPWPNLFETLGPIPSPNGIVESSERARRRRRAIEIISSHPFAGPPDSDIRYSDQGLILLGEAVARLYTRVTRRRVNGDEASLDEALGVRVLKPLGLHTTMFNPLLAGVPRSRIAPTEFDARWRRRRVQGEVHDENAAALGGVAGHAGLFSTARDVGLFGQAWLNAVLTGDSLLPVPVDVARDAVQIQESARDLRRGLGWMLKATGEYASAGQYMSLSTFGHTGYTGTSLFIDPTRELVVVALTNRVYHGRAVEPISQFRPALHDAIIEAMELVAESVA